jgi:hypothetical protein
MKTTNLYCDFCKKITTQEDKKLEPLHGFRVELGYSRGGWGSRQDFVRPQSAEICSECFGKVEVKAREMEATIANCRPR